MSREDGFASRWSRLKQAAKEEAATPEPEPDLPATVEEEDTRTDAEILADLNLPDPATLTEGDDIKGFLQAEVPQHLRRLALRQLWKLNPALANLDGLVEYGEDYTDATRVVENMATLYQVGKGMLRDIVEDEPDAAVDPTPAIEEVDALAEPDGGLVSQPEAEDNEESQTALTAEANLPQQDKALEETEVPARAPRMRFHFDESDR